MTLAEYITFGSVAVGLVANAVAYGWKGGSSATAIKEALAALKEQHAEIKIRLAHLDKIPVLANDVEYLKKHHSLIPKLAARLDVVEAHQQHSKEMRQVLRRSRPDTDGD